jgi:hypothetical protein
MHLVQPRTFARLKASNAMTLFATSTVRALGYDKCDSGKKVSKM